MGGCGLFFSFVLFFRLGAAEQQHAAKDQHDADCRKNGETFIQKTNAEHGGRHRLDDAERGGGACGKIAQTDGIKEKGKDVGDHAQCHGKRNKERRILHHIGNDRSGLAGADGKDGHARKAVERGGHCLATAAHGDLGKDAVSAVGHARKKSQQDADGIAGKSLKNAGNEAAADQHTCDAHDLNGGQLFPEEHKVNVSVDEEVMEYNPEDDDATGILDTTAEDYREYVSDGFFDDEDGEIIDSVMNDN